MDNQVAWIGADGNLWWRQGDNVINSGSANNYEFTNGGLRALNFNTALGEGAGFAPGVTQIADPNAPVSAPRATSGSTTPAKVLNQAGINNTQQTIDQIPGLLEAAVAAERQRYANTIGEFNSQEQGQRKTYGDSTVTNQKNFDSNFMDSIRAGIKGLGGVMSMLRGTGAGGGTAEDMARDTVGGVTANDIRTGADTREENQMQLDNSMGSFLSELARKRKMNEDTLVNNERAVRRDSNTQLQDLFGKMAGFYGDVDNVAESNNWMARAGALTPEIAANSRTQVSNYDTAPVTVKAPELTAFAAPTQPSMATASNGQVGSGIFTMTDPRRRKEQPALVPVGV